MKRLIFFLFNFFVAINTWSADFSVNGLNYIITSDTTVEITTSNVVGDIVIPSKVNFNSIDYSVTSIGDTAFVFNYYITSVSIPNSVKSIGNSAFRYCSGMTSIEIPTSITSIGNLAFCVCSSLKSVSIPTSVISINPGVFYNCSSLKTVSIPNSVTSIGANAFEYCTGLNSVVIPASVASIEKWAFKDCSSLDTIYSKALNPAGLEEQVFKNVDTQKCVLSVPAKSKAAYQAANQWKSFTKIEDGVADTLITFTVNSTAGGLSAAIKAAGGNVSTLTSLAVTGGIDVRDIKFMRDSLPIITNIDLSTAEIKEYFGLLKMGDVTEVSPMTYEANVLPSHAFARCSTLVSIKIPNTVTTINPYAFRECFSLKIVPIPSTVTNIGHSTFKGCSSLTEISLPSSITSISDYTFWLCTGLKSINIPRSVTYIGADAFSNCKSLTSVPISNSVTTIEKEAFLFCSKLKSISIPSSVKYIGINAFQFCDSLNTIYSYSLIAPYLNLYVAGDQVFGGVNKTTCVLYVPKGSKGSYLAAKDWQTFQTIKEMDGVLGINSVAGGLSAALVAAGKDKTIITNLTITGSIDARDIKFIRDSMLNVTEINLKGVKVEAYEGSEGTLVGSYIYKADNLPINSFKNCSRLTSVLLPTSITSIGDNAFENCDGLALMSIPNSVASIGKAAFTGCKSLVSMEIPNLVTILEEKVFAGCSSLISVTTPNSVTSIGKSTFMDCKSLSSIKIPSLVSSIADSAFMGCNILKTVTIPKQVTSIGGRAFSGCNNLKKLSIPQSTTSIGTNAFSNCSNLDTIFSYSPSPVILSAEVFKNVDTMTSVLYIPKGSKIAYQAAEQWKSFQFIKEVGFVFATNSVPGGLSAAIAAAGGDFNVITDLTVTGSIDARDFKFMRDSIPALVHIDLSTAQIKAYTGLEGTYNGSCSYSADVLPQLAFSDNTKINSVQIPNTVISIDYCAFLRCSSLNSIEIPSSVVSISSSAFKYCCDLISVTIPNSVTSIGSFAFSDCSSLTKVSIPNSVSTMGSSVFYNCSSLISVSLPNAITTIETNSFSHCKSLVSVLIPNSVKIINEAAFSDCVRLQSLKIPNGVTSLEKYAFSNCTSLKVFSIPRTVTSIKAAVFADCISLDTIYSHTSTPVNVSMYNSYYASFSGVDTLKCMLCVPLGSKAAYQTAAKWKSFKIVEVPDFTVEGLDYKITSDTTVEVIHVNLSTDFGLRSAAISDDVKKVVVPNFVVNDAVTYRVTSIGSHAFSGCSSISSVTIPNTIISIKAYAFAGCSNLDTIYSYAVSLPNIEENIFANVDTITCVLSVPKGSEAKYRNALQWKSFQNIVEMDGVTNVANDASLANVKAVVKQGKLELSGLYTNTDVFVYNLQGIEIVSAKTRDGALSIVLPAHGVYVVRVANKSIKVIY